MITAIVDWLNTYESALSAIAALIVIGTVAATVGRRWMVQGSVGASSPATPAGGNSNPQPVTDRPSIAVLPFENTSHDPSSEPIADGLTTEIIAGLSANRHLFVIARNSCFTYKGRRVDVRDAARELGVRYVLEGTVRPRDDRVRVSAQLIDASNGATTWSQRFDVPVEDLFKLDDIVTAEIISALLPELRRAEARRARENPVDLDAWSRVNAAWLDLQSDLANQTVANRAIKELEDVLTGAPDFALAHAVLAHAYSLAMDIGNETSPESQANKEKSLEHISRAVALDPDDPAIRHLAGAALSNYRMSEEAQRSYEKALDLNGDYAPALGSLGVSLLYSDKVEKAVPLIERALRLSPREPQAYHWQSHLALANAILGNPARALELAKAATERQRTLMGRTALLMAHAELGNTQEAEAAADDLRRSLPGSIKESDLYDLLRNIVHDDARHAELFAALRPYLVAGEATGGTPGGQQ